MTSRQGSDSFAPIATSADTVTAARARTKTRHEWRNSIVRYADEDPGQLLASPQNWRVHPKEQVAALTGSLTEIGWIAPVIVNETTQHVIDGHARIGEAIARSEPTVPVAYVNLTEAQERLALATFDPISAMAGTDQAMLDALLSDLTTADGGLTSLLDGLKQVEFDPNAEWQGMPEFEQDKLVAREITVKFMDASDAEVFARAVGQPITPETRSIWYPVRNRLATVGMAYRPADET